MMKNYPKGKGPLKLVWSKPVKPTTPKMQARHYRFIADIIHESRVPDMRLRMAMMFAKRLAEDNPKFDREQFIMAACYPLGRA